MGKMKINECKDVVDAYLEKYFLNKGSYNKTVYEAASYSLNIGGKRVRPLLLMLTYQMYKNNCEDVVEMAAAIEMIHTYSLIHDDLPAMDNDDLRRGKPTNHKVFGENMAILAGDALLNEAMIVMMNYAIKNGHNALMAAREVAVAAGAEGMIGGQVVDILSETKEEISEDELRYMHLKKTGELIRASIVSGALLASASEEDIRELELFGKKLGLAFQIKDDILDVIGNAEKLGKNTNKDEECNKTNFITVYGIEKCEGLCKELTDQCLDILDKLKVDSTYLREMTIKLLDREY